MRYVSWSRTGLGTMLMALMLLGPLAVGRAQDAAGNAQDKKAAAPADAQKTRGRLPPYYGRVIDQEQRTKIYEIQARFNAQLDKLRLEMDSLVTKRDAEIEGVLTAEQRDQVSKMRDDARSRRGSASKAQSTDSSKPPTGDGKSP
jgi:hypothetical protein